jgi:predicted TPR repeat methyltransferase
MAAPAPVRAAKGRAAAASSSTIQAQVDAAVAGALATCADESAAEAALASIRAASAGDAGLIARACDQLLAAARTNLAIALCSEAVMLAPRDTRLLRVYAAALRHVGAYGQAALICADRIRILGDRINEGGLQATVPVLAEIGTDFSVLAHCLLAEGDAEAALEAFGRAAALRPEDAGAVADVTALMIKLSRWKEALEYCTGPAGLRAPSARLHVLAAHAAMQTGDEAATIRFQEQAVAEAPDDEGFAHLLAVYRGNHPESSPAVYVTSLFDGYADDFESSLVGKLRYRTPGLIVRRLERQHTGRRFSSCLDLGCGTGLAGLAVRDTVDRLVGVDLSGRMIEQAAAKGIYDLLRQGDLTAFLVQPHLKTGTCEDQSISSKTDCLTEQLAARETGDTYDLILAADVFVYFGCLSKTIDLAARRLDPNGLFLFHVESWMPENGADADRGFVIGRSGRYAHSRNYLEAVLAAAGLVGVIFEEDLRLERGKPVAGYFVEARHAAQI